ncbi:uncharacterized protein LOC128745411 [Sabethes cyaneus]|uniref:uncharacterized protein LOC128745411 n=1 Tax=Sabethes cyaneus TaxID=53552 RepID=UPI00237DFDA9|nr:uncharacterized protein LOC128745411 [Sabethes cyaneus]
MSVTIGDLPEEMLDKIFTYLSLEDRKAVSRVCLHWSRLALRRMNFQLAIDVRRNKLERTYLRVLLASNRRYRHLWLYFGSRQDKSDLMLVILRRFADSLETLKIMSDSTIALRLDFLSHVIEICRNLRTLHLQSVLFQHHDGSEITFGVLPKLDRLYLRSNLLEFDDVPIEKMTPNITSLFVMISYVSPRPIEFLRHFSPRLKQLEIRFLTDDHFNAFSRLGFPQLEQLSLSSADSLLEGSRLTSYVEFFNDLSHLVELTLQYEISTPVLGSVVKCCKNLQSLCLNTEELLDEHFALIGELKYLKALRLMSANIDIEKAELVPVMPNLRLLTLEALAVVKSLEMNNFLRRSFPALVTLQLLRLCSHMNSASMNIFYSNLMSNLNTLERLVLSEKENELDMKLLSCFAQLPRLHILQLHFRNLVHYNSQHDLSSIGSFRTLVLDVRNVSDEILQNLLDHLPKLKQLEMPTAHLCSADGLLAIRKKHPECTIVTRLKFRMHWWTEC